jgi:phosphotriesterase-related protein
MKYIQTVKGKISPDQLGKTLMHEHCRCIQPNAYRKIESGDPEFVAFLNSRVSIENRGKIYFHMHKHNDNLNIDDEQLTIRELEYFKKAGGESIVDVTTPGIGRDVTILKRISEATGLNIIASTGLYIEDSHPDEFRRMDKEEIAEFFIKEIREGIDGTGIKPGYIGEIGISDDYTDREVVVLRAAAIAQRETGFAVTIHQPIFQLWANRILDVLEEEGADLDRVVMSHCDPTLYNVDYHVSILKRGARVQFDQFSLEFPVTYGPYVKRWLPKDIERIRAIKHLMDLGYEDKLTVSMDLCFKSLYRTMGGYGYSYIIEDLYEYFLAEGISEEQFDKLLCKNPATILSVEL